MEAKLAAALNQLRDAQTWTLRGVESHEDRTDQVAHHDGDETPEQVVAHENGKGTRDDRANNEIGCEPDIEEVARPTVSLPFRDEIDVVLFDRNRHDTGGPC